MQAKIIYTLVFLIAFALTTGAMIFLNNKYENIFKFNFAPAGTNVKVASAEKKKDSSKSEKDIESAAENTLAVKPENSQTAESSKTENTKDKSVSANSVQQPEQNKQTQSVKPASSDSLNKMKLALEQTKKSLAEKDKELQNAKTAGKARQDSAYTEWKRSMIKTYEKMDPRSVAKILVNMNDNYARDILFSLKDKKRAQIIETILNINPEAASRLTRIP